jgi:hypothetical protein
MRRRGTLSNEDNRDKLKKEVEWFEEVIKEMLNK